MFSLAPVIPQTGLPGGTGAGGGKKASKVPGPVTSNINHSVMLRSTQVVVLSASHLRKTTQGFLMMGSIKSDSSHHNSTHVSWSTGRGH